VIRRHRVVATVVLTAISSLGIASACGVEGSIEGASSGVTGSSGSAGTSGVTGSAGTSGTSGTSGTTGGPAPKTEVKELAPSNDLRAIAVGGEKLVFAESDGLQWCHAPDCTAKTGVSNPPGQPPTTVTFGDAKFYGAFDMALRACEVKPNEVNCNGGDSVTDVLLVGATRLRYDGQSFVWVAASSVKWFAPGSGIQDVAGGSGHDGIALAGNRLFFTSIGTAGKALAISDFFNTAMAGNGPGNKTVLAPNLVEPNDIASEGADVFVAVSGNPGLSNGSVIRCRADASSPCSTFASGLEGPRGIAVDGTNVYVSETRKDRGSACRAMGARSRSSRTS